MIMAPQGGVVMTSVKTMKMGQCSFKVKPFPMLSPCFDDYIKRERFISHFLPFLILSTMLTAASVIPTVPKQTLVNVGIETPLPKNKEDVSPSPPPSSYLR